MRRGERATNDRRGRPPKKRVSEEKLQGFKFFDRMRSLLEVLRQDNAHHNRKLHYDEYALALIFYFLNPMIDSLRGLQQATEFKRVQKALGIRRMSLGSMSESVRIFDPDLLAKIFERLASQAPERSLNERLEGLDQILTVVDGSVLRALPRMVWALWLRDTDRGVRMHTQFEVAKDTPVEISMTPGNGSETSYLRENLKPGRLYVLDRGYAFYELLQSILEADSSFVVRLKNNVAYNTLEKKELTPDAEEAGVVSDKVVRLGCEVNQGKIDREVRLVEIYVPERDTRSLAYPVKKVSSKKCFRRDPGQAYPLYLATDRLDLPADVIALIYQHRWKIELFFRVMKCVLGCRHLLSDSLEGITIQVYAALIASLLLADYTGVRPTKRTYELLSFYLSGWVDDDELAERLNKLKKA